MAKALGERISLDLSAGNLGEDDLHVLGVEGREALSTPYVFDVTFHEAKGEPIDPADFLHQPAVLAFRRSTGENRYVHGDCVRIELLRIASGTPLYRLRVAPKLLRLAEVFQSRIFQGKSIPDVVREVLKEQEIKTKVSLGTGYATRDYVTQYRESDLAFVARLLAEEGIWYRFDHTESDSVLVLADASSGLADVSTAVPQRHRFDAGDGIEHLAHLESTVAIASGKASERDYDFERPALDLSAEKGEGELLVYRYPGGYTQAAAGKRVARLHLEMLQADAATWSGSGNSLAFVPGVKVTVEEGPTVAVVRVRHTASQERAAAGQGKGTHYENSFEAVDAKVPWRPPLAPARPRLGVQTAIVVGPAGEEIYVDQYQRIKVQLHWDREGKKDEHSSCWMRVAVPWAGPGMGVVRVPRIGQEVVVRWLEGDPDRPLVTGAVFNGSDPVPLALPDDKTRSVLRSATLPGSDGSNEWTLEDAAGKELVFVHAQKDWNGVVVNDRSESVGHDAALEVGKDRARGIAGAQRRSIGQSETIAIGGNVTLTVGAAQTALVSDGDEAQVGTTRAVTVGASRTLSVLAASAEFVGAAAALTIGGGYAISVGGGLNYAVGGLLNTAIGGASVEVVGASREETVAKSRTSQTQGDVEIQVKGGVTLVVAGDEEERVDGAVEIEVKGGLDIICNAGKLQADQLTVIVGGNTALLLKKSGDVNVAASSVKLNSDGKLTLKGGTAKMVSGSSAASGSASVTALQDLDPAKKVAKVTFADKKGKPALAGVKFKLKTPSGDKQGTVSASGLVSVGDLKPGKCELELLDLDAD